MHVFDVIFIVEFIMRRGVGIGGINQQMLEKVEVIFLKKEERNGSFSVVIIGEIQ